MVELSRLSEDTNETGGKNAKPETSRREDENIENDRKAAPKQQISYPFVGPHSSDPASELGNKTTGQDNSTRRDTL